jgi:hypothetical protein
MIVLMAHEFSWLGDPKSDFCAHAKVEFRVRNTSFITPSDGEWTVSGAGLYLLRTLSFDHSLDNSIAESNFLFPCCAFSIWLVEEKFKVMCIGCPNGIDVEVRHVNGMVHLELNGVSEQVTESEWREAVLSFVNQVEQFYITSEPKIKVNDENERNGLEGFWQEWHERKSLS